MATNNSLLVARALGVGLIILSLGLNAAGANKSKAGSISVELRQPYAKVIAAVQKVASDGAIRGTTEYRREPELTGALGADASPVFGAWNGPGRALYKIKFGALSPAHFRDSNDMGTLAVRYLVQEIDPGRTSLTIDAIFEPASHHGRHLSDGSVEAAELAEIDKELSPASRPRPAQKVAGLQGEAEQVAVLRAQVQELESRLQSLNRELADRAAAPASPIAPAAKSVAFQVLREQVQAFSGDWEPLAGKPALYLWVVPAGVNRVEQTGARWSFAEQIFLDHARESSTAYAGVVVIFLDARGGIAAATAGDIAAMASGRISDTAFRQRCSLDPLGAFVPAEVRQASNSYSSSK